MQPVTLQIRLAEPEAGSLEMIGQPTIPLGGQEIAKGSFFVVLSKDQLDGRMTKINLEVLRGDTLVDQVKTNFLGPIPGFNK